MKFKEEIDQSLEYVKIDTDLVELDLRECIKLLPDASLNKLYYSYDVESFLSKRDIAKKPKNTKVNYLVREVPGQFIDYLQFMLDAKQKKTLKDLCNGREIKLHEGFISFAHFGFIYMNKNEEIILPLELKEIAEDLL